MSSSYQSRLRNDNSTVFNFGDTLVNLLKVSEAPALVEPADVAPRDAGVRFQFTLGVDDATRCARNWNSAASSS
jgi:hypothetical protein